jgi:pimeloyl-ACP methyl ester carboxylesterase
MKEAYAGSTAYRTAGRGAPVVLIHGVGLDATIWEAQAAALAERYRVVAYDMLGHGQSACPPGARELGDFVDQLAELLDALELRRVALVGFSMGGLVARAFAAAYPERVSHLALLSTAYERSPEEQTAILTRLAQAETEGPTTLGAAALDRWFSPGFRTAHPEVVARIRERLASNDGEGFLAAYRVFAEADSQMAAFLDSRGLAGEGPDGGRRIACPALIVTGEEDPGSSPAMARRLADAIAGARCLILPGMRHLALMEAPEAVTNPLIDFLEQQARSTGKGEP